jgi:RimJ/RimL family protein N-acetyltransferase
MRRSMKEIWSTHPSDVVPRTDCAPIDWKPFSERRVLNDQYLLRAIRDTPRDLADAAEAMRTSFSVIRDTEFDILFQPQGFTLILGEGETFLKGERFVLVAEEIATKKVVGVLLLNMAKKQRNCEVVVIVTHEDYQDIGIGQELAKAFDHYIEQCGVEMAFVWAAAEHSATQKIMKSLGFVPRAVIPGYYRIWGENNTYRRTIEVFMQKFYSNAENMATQQLDLLPETQKLIVPW